MSSSGFLQGLQNFPKDSINEETVELMTPLISMEDYTFESAKKVCGDVAGLLSWSKAMAFFYGINKEVLPLKVNIAHLTVFNALCAAYFMWIQKIGFLIYRILMIKFTTGSNAIYVTNLWFKTFPV